MSSTADAVNRLLLSGQYHTILSIVKGFRNGAVWVQWRMSPSFLVRDSSAVRALSIRKTADLPLQLWVGTFPRFVAIGFYFLSETLIWIASPNIFLSIHNHLTLRKWCCTRLQHDFALDPIISSFDFHFRTYKRDLAILTEWWQQHIEWWEQLNAVCQIICIRKQQHAWYKAYSAGQTVPSTAQIRAEGNNKKCVGKKRFNGSVTHGLRKVHVLRSPPTPSHFGQSKIIYMHIISHDTLR